MFWLLGGICTAIQYLCLQRFFDLRPQGLKYIYTLSNHDYLSSLTLMLRSTEFTITIANHVQGALARVEAFSLGQSCRCMSFSLAHCQKLLPNIQNASRRP